MLLCYESTYSNSTVDDFIHTSYELYFQFYIHYIAQILTINKWLKSSEVKHVNQTP